MFIINTETKTGEARTHTASDYDDFTMELELIRAANQEQIVSICQGSSFYNREQWKIDGDLVDVFVFAIGSGN